MFADFVALVGDEWPPRRVVFGRWMVVSKGCYFGENKDWMARHQENLKRFGSMSAGRREPETKTGWWFREVGDETAAYMRKLNGVERSNAAKQHTTNAAATVTRTVDTD